MQEYGKKEEHLSIYMIILAHITEYGCHKWIVVGLVMMDIK